MPLVTTCFALALATVAAAELPEGKQYDNTLGMHLVRIEPGRFQMGSPEGGDFDERPVHEVTVTQPFLLGATEVTNAQYEQFAPDHHALRGKLGMSQADDEAVVFVSWEEAAAFCRWLSRKEKQPYRLPTEAEWEFACRAGTTTAYSTGDKLPAEYLKNPGESWFPATRRGRAEPPVELHVGRTPPNPWGLCDMHGNVEEWCHDWYGPYVAEPQTDPLGRSAGEFRVTRGGSHSTTAEYLRSANRSGTLPEDKSWLIGFRVVLAELPAGHGSSPVPPPANACRVLQSTPPAALKPPPGFDRQPYFSGPQVYVKVPDDSQGPLFSKHNHDPGIAECPNGDLLAIWYTCYKEPGRELAIAASRLRWGDNEWEAASPFWDTPDRNDHAPALWYDGQRTLYHFNGLSAAATWGSLATILRTSTDNGVTWSRARLIQPEHGTRHMPVESVFRTRDEAIILPCDAVPDGEGGTAIQISTDEGRTWIDPGQGQPPPTFAAGSTGAWIAGIHASVAELNDKRLMAFGRGNTIDGHMPMSLSSDAGRSWTYSASPFPPISSGQRLVLTRLHEGPLLLISFGKSVEFRDAAGRTRTGSGMFAALSEDEGQTWTIRRLITDDGPTREMDGGGNTHKFTMSAAQAEPRGYLAICQARNGVIHLISSKLHYAFNLAWLKKPPPAE